MNLRIGVITPVSHLEGVRELLSNKGEVFYLENGNKADVKKFILDNNINTLLCNPNAQSYKIDQELLHSTNVTLINTCSTGLNHIDVKYCQDRQIQIYSLKNDFKLLNNLPSTSELALTLMLSLIRKIPSSLEHVRNYKWDYQKFVGRMASELSVGVVGYGRLGKFMAKYCSVLCKEVIIYDPFVDCSEFKQADKLGDLFEQCDIISLHIHVSEDTINLINKEVLDKSKKIPYIINTSRGEIVNEQDIINALDAGLISGYGADVVVDEFDDITKSPIIQAMNRGLNVIVTPHTGGMTIEGQTMAYDWAINKF